MLYHSTIDVSGGTDVNKISESEECDVCHYWYFLDEGFKFQIKVLRCRDLLMMSINLNDIAILNIQGSDYRRSEINGIRKSEAINLMQNTDLTEKSGTLLNIKKYFYI